MSTHKKSEQKIFFKLATIFKMLFTCPEVKGLMKCLSDFLLVSPGMVIFYAGPGQKCLLVIKHLCNLGILIVISKHAKSIFLLGAFRSCFWKSALKLLSESLIHAVQKIKLFLHFKMAKCLQVISRVLGWTCLLLLIMGK